MIGTKPAHYEVEARLGAGGMGEVYRAYDSRLGRRVAIKLLPEVFEQDPNRTARFEHEARVPASLNHPNIAALYGLENANGKHFLVMELVEGQTLAEIIARGSLSIEDALPIAHQIAQALESAHELGIVHRDIKPANVKVTAQGKVKVLDFGLAKAVAGPRETDLSNSPTAGAAITHPGIIMGSAAYMSPEQAKGFATDPRTDVFSFGCLLYEMLAARKSFSGDSLTDVLASVLARDTDYSLLPQDLHPGILQLIRRCLEKDKNRRWQRMADVRAVIEAVLPDVRGLKLPQSVGTPTTSVWKRALPIVVTAAVATLITVVVLWYWQPATPGGVSRFTLTLPENQLITRPGRHVIAVSPDGNGIAFVANRQLNLWNVRDNKATPIPETDLDINTPFFSPDGAWIGFYAVPQRKLKKVAIAGGSPVTVGDVDNPFGATWTSTGQILIGQGARGVVRVSASGGEPETVIRVNPDELAHGPQMLPDNDHVLLTLAPDSGPGRWDKARIVIHSLKTGERKVLIDGGSDAHYVSTGHIVYAMGPSLLAVPFDLARLQILGGSVSIAEDIARTEFTGAVHFDFSASGVME